jgi:large subunit ribosomal protein L16
MMLLFPKKPKYLKSFSNKKITKTNTKKQGILRFSCLALIANEAGFIPNFQIEASRLFFRRLLKKRAQLFFRFFPNQPVTVKPNEVRLGRGKGNLKYWTFYAKKGQVLLEVYGSNMKTLTNTLVAIRYKLTVKCYIYNKRFR